MNEILKAIGYFILQVITITIGVLMGMAFMRWFFT